MPENAIPKKILREMKYLSDQKGIMNRYYEEYKGWNEHLQKCRTFILEQIRKHKPGSAMILGSGWLLDVPLEELLEECSHVFLADIHHPLQVRHKVSRLDNASLVTADLSGGAIRQVYNLVKAYRKDKITRPLDSIILKHPDLPEADYYVSLNLLNQLDILLVDYIRRYMHCEEDVITGFRKMIQQHHLSVLKPGHSCLVSDVKEIVINRWKKVCKEIDLVHIGLPEGKSSERWTWKFDRKEYNPGYDTHMEVVALEL